MAAICLGLNVLSAKQLPQITTSCPSIGQFYSTSAHTNSWFTDPSQVECVCEYNFPDI